MKAHLFLLAGAVLAISACHRNPGDAQRQADEKRITELRDLEERAAQRDTEAKAAQLDADRQKLASDQAALDEEKRQLDAQRAAAQNDGQRQAQLQESERLLEQREAAQRTAQQRTDDEERALQAARDARDEKRSANGRNIDYFYNALDPMGDWIETSSYGYVWQPREAQSPGWRPYTDGTWVYTDYGWTWNANEPFGWATYHYGRWTQVQGRGWVWVPGSEWAPAWVSWRKSPQYVGWAPLPPEAHSSAGFNGAVDSYYDIGPASYNFVPLRSIGEPTYRGLVVAPERNFTIIVDTSNVTRMNYTSYGRETVYYNDGPDFVQINSYSARPIQRYRLERESSRDRLSAGGGNSVAGNVLHLLAPPIISAPHAAAAPVRVAARLGAAPVEHGWGTGGNANVEAIRAKTKQEAAQAEVQATREAASAPAKATPRPFFTTTGTPRPAGGTFGTGAPQKTFGTGPLPKPAVFSGTPVPLKRAGLSTVPGFATPFAASHRESTLNAPSTPHPITISSGTPVPLPVRSTPQPLPLVHEKPNKPAPLATPHPEKMAPLAEPGLTRPEAVATPHPKKAALPAVAPAPNPRPNTPPTIPLEKPRKATGGEGVPVIPASTPRRGPANPEGGPEPRKTVPPTGKSTAQASPTASPTPKKH